ncbi:MAG: MCE family protein [wastewater metagenome]|nr:MCE family protein [Candidatus Loosdrechtia aerotolerans]
MEPTQKSAIKVGIFVIIGMAILAALTFRIEKLAEWGDYYDLIAYFNEAGGLKAEDDVTLAGTKVGYVKSVTVEGDKIKVVLSVKEDIPVREGSKASIIAGYLLGENRVNITLAPVSRPVYEPGDVIETVETLTFADMMAKVDNALSGIQNILAPLKDTEGLIASMKSVGKSLEEAGPQLNKLLDSTLDITEKINKGQGTLGKLITDETLINKITSAADVAQRIFTENEQNISDALAGLGDIGPQLREALQGLNDALQPLTEKDVFVNISAASESIKNILERIEEGEGTLPKLITSDELYVELKKLVDDLRETVQGYREQIPVGAFGSIVFSAF